MKLVAICPVRNEEWCLGLTARAALMWCDELVLWLHACTDRSEDIADQIALEHRGRVEVDGSDDDQWSEMEHRQLMLAAARERGATHIAMIDADEILTGNLRPKIRSMIDATPPGTVLQLPWLALPRTTDRYITSGVWGPGQQVSMAFKDQPSAHWRLEGKLDGRDHEHRNPMGLPERRFSALLKPEQGGLMHLQFLSERRLRAKQAWYQAEQVIRNPAPSRLEGRFYRTPEELAARLRSMYGRAVYESNPNVGYGNLSPCATACIPLEWWLPYAHLMSYLDPSEDKAPWQEVELKRLIAEHGREKFAGLDFFGVA